MNVDELIAPMDAFEVARIGKLDNETFLTFSLLTPWCSRTARRMRGSVIPWCLITSTHNSACLYSVLTLKLSCKKQECSTDKTSSQVYFLQLSIQNLPIMHPHVISVIERCSQEKGVELWQSRLCLKSQQLQVTTWFTFFETHRYLYCCLAVNVIGIFRYIATVLDLYWAPWLFHRGTLCCQMQRSTRLGRCLFAT